MVFMPSLRPPGPSGTPGGSCPSRIRLRIAGVATSTSAATHPRGAVGGRDELLGDDALERRRDLDAHLLLLLGRERVDDPVDGLRRVLGVERAEHEVTGLGRGDRGRDRLEVAHLTDQDDVGVLTQRLAQRGRERLGVGADVALAHERHLRLVHELDRAPRS